MAKPKRPPRKKASAKPLTRHHKEPKDCNHPVGSLIGDYCAECGEKVRGR